MSQRRVVTGHDADDRPRVLSDRDLEPITLDSRPGFELYRVWEFDGQATIPGGDRETTIRPSFFPSEPGAVRFGFVVVPPPAEDAAGHISPAEAQQEIAEKIPGYLDAFDGTEPGMHATKTVDFVTVISGAGSLRLPDGEEIALRAGDCIVQQGTAHAWVNPGPDPFVLCFVLCGGTPRPG